MGYHLEVRKIHESKLLNNQLFIHRQSTAQASRFTTTELAELEVKLLEAGKKSLEMELKIFKELVIECLEQSETKKRKDGSINFRNSVKHAELSDKLKSANIRLKIILNHFLFR